jgi:hypothetical protein
VTGQVIAGVAFSPPTSRPEAKFSQNGTRLLRARSAEDSCRDFALFGTHAPRCASAAAPVAR